MAESMLDKATRKMTKALNIVRTQSAVEKHIERLESELVGMGETEIARIEQALASMRLRIREAHHQAIMAKAEAVKERSRVGEEMANAATIAMSPNREYMIPDDYMGLYEYTSLASDNSLRMVSDMLDQERLKHIVKVLTEK